MACLLLRYREMETTDLKDRPGRHETLVYHMQMGGVMEGRSTVRLHRLVPVLVTFVFLFSFLIFPQFEPCYAAEGKPVFDLSTAIVQVAKKNIPAVVHIEVTGQQEVAVPLFPFDNDPFFRQFFGAPKSPRKYKRETKGMGTGMIIDVQGHILTNYHVVGAATKIDVLLSNGNRYQAKLVGTDPKTDLAVIRISTKERLPHVTFGNSDQTEVGEWVVAIGHPRGLDQTVTHGIISAKHRTGITDPTGYQDFLQTDAAINPGNSGGPLLSLRGEVIGVNTVIVSGSGGFEGIGLSIPSNIATYIAKTIIAKGKVERGWLGISTQDVTSENAKSLGLETPRGALIADVAKGSPADKAGIRKGDVVTSYMGKETPNASRLRNEVAVTPAGSEARLTLLRNGKKQDVTVKIGNLQDAAKFMSASVMERLGIEARPATAKEAKRLGLQANEGLVVSKVEKNGPLAKVGFEPGDMILEINGQEITGVQQFVEIVGTLGPKQRITILALDYKTRNKGYVEAVTR
jgi:serine protease Do